MLFGLVETIMLLVGAKREVHFPLSAGYMSSESGLSDHGGAAVHLLHNDVAVKQLAVIVEDFGKRRLNRPWSTLESRNLGDLFCTLAKRPNSDVFPHPVLVWEFGARKVQSARKTSGFYFKADGAGRIIQLVMARPEKFAEFVCSAREVALIHSLVPWERISPVHSFVSVQFRGEGFQRAIDSLAGDELTKPSHEFTEIREHFGFVDVNSAEERQIVADGFFPCQAVERISTNVDPAVTIDEPYITMAIIDQQPVGMDLQECPGRAYTMHVNPRTGKVTAFIAYYVYAERRLRSMPDAVRILEEIQAKYFGT